MNLLEDAQIPSFFRIRTRSSKQKGGEEEQRSQVPGVFLERIVQDLHEYAQGCVGELVFNLDEVGSSDWEDRETKKVIALAAMLTLVRRYIMEYLEMWNTFR
jgi:hypothetical protein